jgi:hypothetical protein
MLGDWLQRWRDEYYTENPVVWLLAKTESELCLRQISAPEPAEAGSAPSRLQLLKSDVLYSDRYFHWADESEFERTLLAPWHLPSNRWLPLSDQLYLAFASLVTMTVLVIHYALAKSPVWVGAVGVGVVIVMFFAPMARPMLALHSLAQTLTAETPLHVGVSRLTPAHLVYGALLYGVGRIARTSAVYGHPACASGGDDCAGHGLSWAADGDPALGLQCVRRRAVDSLHAGDSVWSDDPSTRRIA